MMSKMKKPQIMHYDTGYYMYPDSWTWSKENIDLEVQNIKEFLNITSNSYDEEIKKIVGTATYGGYLLIYFKVENDEELNKILSAKSISFTNYVFGIVEHTGGSGDVTEIPIKEPFNCEFRAENLFAEKDIKYNWTYEIAGMDEDWADSTEVEVTDYISVKKIKESAQTALNKQEEEYNKTFKSGKCTFGDTDMDRHEDVYYINDFPCGWKCKRCGTFWID